MTIRNIEAWNLKLNETDVSQNTNLKELRNEDKGNLELHTKAKAGDVKTAVELVKRVVKQNVLDDLKQLAKEHKTAVVLPLLAKEETGHNKLPRAYADIIADATGLKVDNRIKQINKTNHTKENRTERLTDLAKFDGKVVKGQEYILVDDVLTTGSNINELRKYIERRGGKVIHVAVLATGIRGKEVFQPVVAETKKNLYDKFERVLNGQEKSETNILTNYCDTISLLIKDFKNVIILIQRIKLFLNSSLNLINSIEICDSVSIKKNNIKYFKL